MTAAWYPCLTYIIGFPDEKVEDYVETLELIDKLRDEGFKGWIFPLFLVPMGGTLIESKAEFKELEDLPREAVDCIAESWLISIKFSRTIYPKLMSRIKSKPIYRIVNYFAEKAFETMESWIKTLKTNPGEALKKTFPKINIRRMPQLIATAIKAKLRLI